MTDRKPILVLDFDGVLHAYTSPWTTAAEVRDGPVPGAMAFLYEAFGPFNIAISSSRSSDPAGVEAMREAIAGWLHDDEALNLSNDEIEALLHEIAFPTEKPPAFVTIDDRALTFTGRWPAIDELLAFKPWNKREPIEKVPVGETAIDSRGQTILLHTDGRWEVMPGTEIEPGHLPATEALADLSAARMHLQGIQRATMSEQARMHALSAIEHLRRIADEDEDLVTPPMPTASDHSWSAGVQRIAGAAIDRDKADRIRHRPEDARIMDLITALGDVMRVATIAGQERE